MKPRRFGAALVAAADSAGTIASSNGSASAAPTPRRNVRRGKAIFVMIIYLLSLIRMLLNTLLLTRRRGSALFLEGRPPHLERRALHDAEHERRDAIVVARRVAHDRAHGGVGVLFRAPPERIGKRVFGRRRENLHRGQHEPIA